MNRKSEIAVEVKICTGTQKESSNKCRDIVEIFGLPQGGWTDELYNLNIPSEGVVFISGPSGVGKSLLLKEIIKFFKIVREVNRSVPKTTPICDVVKYGDAGSVIRHLSKFGLGEPRIMVGPFEHLSDGQKERFLISQALITGTGPLILDEFTTRLDRQTARVLALNVGKVLRKQNEVAYIASCHDDIVEFLQPDIHIKLSLDGNHSIQKRSSFDKRSEILSDLGIKIEKGTVQDYKKLSRFHYENDDPQDIDKLLPVIDHIVTARSHSGVAGVNLCTLPWPKEFERFSQFEDINKHLLKSFRVIIHPQYRGIGMTRNIDVIPNLNTKAILAISAFTEYYSFPILSGYEKHPSPYESSSDAEQDLMDFVLPRRNRANEPVHAISECRRLLDALSMDDYDKIKVLTARAANEKSIRVATFHRHIIGIPTSTEDRMAMGSVFSSLFKRTNKASLPVLLSEAVYRPMATFVKITNNGAS